MQLTAFRAWMRRNPRHRILFWTTLVGLIFGAIEAGQPVDSVLQTTRNLIRTQPASGDIVVVGIDDKSINEVGQWPWPRSHHAKLIRNLDAMGAQKIVFDFEFSSPSRPAEDRALARALADLSTPATLAVTFVRDPTSQERTDLYPIPAFAKYADLASIYVRYDYQGYVWSLPYSLEHGSRSYPSMSASLANKTGADQLLGDFRVDYSFDPRTVPRVSAVDLLRGQVPRSAIEGKRVVVGPASVQLGDMYFVPGHSKMPGVYLHVLGAETLMRGSPVSVGWLLPFLMAFLAVWVCAAILKGRTTAFVLATSVAAILTIPLYLDSLLIFTTTAPALFLLLSTGTAISWTNFRDSYRQRATTNPVSGMPNLTALRSDEESRKDRPLIAAKIRNYAEIISALSADEQKALAGQIAGRLSVTETNPTIYHGDEGVFAWFADQGFVSVLDDYLDGLHTLFRSPIRLSGTQIDLSVTFGVEADFERNLVSRLGGALAAADDAAEHGLRWKRHDPGRLEEARWKMSLLSQLDAAIDAGDLWIAFQPKVQLPSRRIVGAEALVRWTHREKGEISPMEFVLAAEQSGRIDRLTTFVLERAVAAAAEVNGAGMAFGIAVNISARMISDPRLPGTIAQILDRHRLDPAFLTLEVTETAALSSGDATGRALGILRELGVQISIDDYGTGLSTLEYMKKIPATEIKIDKSFVQAVNESRSDRLMVNSTIQLAHSLGQTVVAEGIEDPETLSALTAMGCDVAQGYFTGRPMKFQSLKKQILAQKETRAA